jgi:heterodisulfide reductase subunit A
MPKQLNRNSRKRKNNKRTSGNEEKKITSNPNKSKSQYPKGALVLGGGIAGIQAALDLAESGVFTYLVERSPSIGGRMAQLDKTFPTNDCAMCILSPKLVAVARHPNIQLLTNSELTSVSGSAGSFEVAITKHPRYIDENKCVGCGECSTKCPAKVSNDFDLDLSERKAIYIPFPQAVPLVYTIDAEHCKYLLNGKCGVCAKICKADAVDYEQKPENLKLKIGSIIVATGYDQYDPSALEELRYDLYLDVITGLEFERMLNASGPTAGKTIKPSNNIPPRNIMFIQCIGSRDKHRACEYCSRVCCMYAVKEAMIAKEHSDQLNDLTVLNMEIRAYGKGFEEYYQRAKIDGINFLHGRAADISADHETGELIVRTENVTEGVVQDIRTDLVVLSSAIVPNSTNKQLSEILSIDLDSNGFFKESNEKDLISSVYSTRNGIFLSGCAQGPKDIPDSVSQGSAAAALAGKYFKQKSRNVLLKAKSPTDQPLPESYEEELRIGMFVCRCGINIGGILDVPELVKYSKTLPDVVYATENLYTCSDDTQTLIMDSIKEHNLNRVIVASCTPRTHEPLFRDTCSQAGLNPYLFEMANIRDQCSWVHMDEPALGTDKGH